ncbi:putative 4Fe-4S ferredoxin, RnfC [Treponema primitia ZAS-2]|uniref:Putative 4Fe-4S ferredoxin, RnfC n=1 Tax=Treponema primitia (strain ATCC BAA-887 / DSM 12427 / ZAS-2) TaxID=545694 RepID=F5YMS4_TREPZ|nr:4Fe-4S dicluster domain-containing protein [Treponema primitia]AEF86806.1 putative 4Fe-4S ferredoxin, RnfC [Treponema primitia ZAS-2]
MIGKQRVYSFPRGGIHYEDPFAPSRDASVTAFLPALSIIPLVQQTGTSGVVSSGGRAVPVVKSGDLVKEGMLIGQGGAGLANVHATVPGRVVRTVSWDMLEGYPNDALVIRLEGAFDKLGRREEEYPWEGLSPRELQGLIAEYGVVEMEGSGLSVSELLSVFCALEEPHALVVNCVFDDPWLAADYVLCKERLKVVVEGSVIAGKAGKADRIIYAISRKERELGELFLAEAASYDIPASVALVGSRYPQRNRRELEMVLRMYAKKENFELGSILPLGPATLAAIYDAVKLKKPILDRYIAVGGSAVVHPQVMKVRIGTRMGELFDECGGFIDKPKRIASGSPLLGRTVTDLDEPVIKTSYAIFALLEGQTGGSRSGSCISCGECRAVCPVGLDPEELFKAVGVSLEMKDDQDEISVRFPSSDPVKLLESSAGKCHGCGCCELVCPSRLPLSTVITNAARETSLQFARETSLQVARETTLQVARETTLQVTENSSRRGH